MMTFLLTAAETILMRGLNLNPLTISMRTDPKPPPTAGDYFIALYGQDYGIDEFDMNQAIDPIFDIGLTITKRTRLNPYDYSQRAEVASETADMEVLLWRCVGWLHQNYDVTTLATTKLQARMANADPYVEPLRFLKADASPTWVGAEWFQPEMSADAIIRKATYPYAAMIMSASLGKARRPTKISKLREEAVKL